MSQRRSIYLIAILIFFTIMLGFGVYVVQQTQTIENQAQVTDSAINEGSCLLQGGTVISSDLTTTTCPSGYTKAGTIQNTALDQSDQGGLADGPTTTQAAPQKICCIPLPTTLLASENPTLPFSLTEIPTPNVTLNPTALPSTSPSIAPTVATTNPSSTPPSPTDTINACIDPKKVPQLEVQINYICPSCK